jgi:hypothetical protein
LRSAAVTIGLPVDDARLAEARSEMARLRQALDRRGGSQIAAAAAQLRRRLSDMDRSDWVEVQPAADELLARVNPLPVPVGVVGRPSLGSSEGVAPTDDRGGTVSTAEDHRAPVASVLSAGRVATTTTTKVEGDDGEGSPPSATLPSPPPPAPSSSVPAGDGPGRGGDDGTGTTLPAAGDGGH